MFVVPELAARKVERSVKLVMLPFADVLANTTPMSVAHPHTTNDNLRLIS